MSESDKAFMLLQKDHSIDRKREDITHERKGVNGRLISYRKSSIKPPGGGGLFNFGLSRRGLIERGAYS